jgi:uncharacterized protein (DUF302 family)
MMAHVTTIGIDQGRGSSGYTLRVETPLSHDAAVSRVRAALAEQGFGVLTEIDVRATMKTKLDVDVPAQVILGACRPELAHRAMSSAPSIAALLPCNVVVRDAGAGRTVVEAIDPAAMSRMDEDPVVAEVAAEARTRIAAALDHLLQEA